IFQLISLQHQSRRKFSSREKSFPVAKKVFQSRRKFSSREESFPVAEKVFQWRRKFSSRDESFPVAKKVFQSRRKFSSRDESFPVDVGPTSVAKRIFQSRIEFSSRCSWDIDRETDFLSAMATPVLRSRSSRPRFSFSEAACDEQLPR